MKSGNTNRRCWQWFHSLCGFVFVAWHIQQNRTLVTARVNDRLKTLTPNLFSIAASPRGGEMLGMPSVRSIIVCKRPENHNIVVVRTADCCYNYCKQGQWKNQPVTCCFARSSNPLTKPSQRFVCPPAERAMTAATALLLPAASIFWELFDDRNMVK